jgi:hypothetical protein
MNGIARGVVEAAGCVVIVGAVQRAFWGAKRDSKTAKLVDLSTTPLVDQANSLTVEFFDILSQLDKSFISRLEESFHATVNNNNKERIINNEDLEEFTQNICSVNDSFLSEMVAPSRKFHESRPPKAQVDERYRLIPTSLVRKVVALLPHKPPDPQVLYADECDNNFIRTLELIHERRRIMLDLAMDFDLQHMRIEKTMKMRAGELYSPNEALWDSRTLIFLQIGCYLAFSKALDQLWTIPPPGELAARIRKPPRWRAAFLILPFVCGLHFVASSVLPMLFDDDIGFDEDDKDLVEELLARSADVDEDEDGDSDGDRDSDDSTGDATSAAPPSSADKSAGKSAPQPSTKPAPLSTGPGSGQGQGLGQEAFGSDAADVYGSFVTVAGPPPVWPGATKSDPFTWQRLSMTLLEKPLADEVLFRGILFARLLASGGLVLAGVLGPLTYAACQMGPGNIDLRAGKTTTISMGSTIRLD